MSKLPEILVEGNAGNGLVRIKLDGTYALKELAIATEIKHMEKEDLEDFIAVALKQAIDQVTQIREKELYESLSGLMGSK
jgi:DNA-binding protein YbaB